MLLEQAPVQGRFKLAHCPISLGTRVEASVRRFETPTALSDWKGMAKKDIPMLLRFCEAYECGFMKWTAALLF